MKSGMPVEMDRSQIAALLLNYLQAEKERGVNRISISAGALNALATGDGDPIGKSVRVEAPNFARLRESLNEPDEVSKSQATNKHSTDAGSDTEMTDLGKIIGKPGSPRFDALSQIYADVKKFYASERFETLRETMVFAVGDPEAQLMFVGEAPGADEEKQREPFVGRAGQKLTQMIKAMGLERTDVYISNIVKYRPRMPDGSETGNRKPAAEEIAKFRPFVLREIELIKPRAIVALGSTSMEGLLGIKESIGRARGQFYDLPDVKADCPVMVTYHPAYLLRNPTNAEKRKIWEDLLLVMEHLGLPVSEKQRNYFL